MNNKKNLYSAIIFQIIHMAYGFIVPRIILGTFGSEINGLVSAITQFLSFISLLEGGLGAVVLAELYKPIEVKDIEKIKSILKACQIFFNKITLVFMLYTLVLSICFSWTMRNKYSCDFIISLVFILALTTIAQYLFSLTYRLYLQANQQIYVNQFVTSVTLIANIIIAYVVVWIFPEIRLLKFASSIAFFIQPLIFKRYVSSTIKDYRNKSVEKITLKNRWSGFAQNLAHFINMNTDIAVITIFSSLINVSIYSVYLMAINALRALLCSATNSYQSALGKYYVQKNDDLLQSKFKSFSTISSAAAIILFMTCLHLVNPFVYLYTNNVNDAEYYQPIFALIIVLANLIYCIREPYRLLILAAGKFKETNFGAVLEAILNLTISVILINFYGLVGVAIGTLVAISYRYFYFLFYIKKDMLKKNKGINYRSLISAIIIIVSNVLIYSFYQIKISSLVGFICYGFLVFILESIITILLFVGIKNTKDYLYRFIKK